MMRYEQANFKFRPRMVMPLLAALAVLAPVLLFSKIALGSSSHGFAVLTRNLGITKFYAGSQTKRKSRSKRARQTTMTQEKFTAVPVSTWGATGIHLNIEDRGVKIEYACAAGEIDGPLKVDRAGKFKADGVHIRLAGGPVKADETPERVPVLYEGKISDRSMFLKVIRKDSKEEIGEYTLTRDKTPRLHRCL